MKAFLSRCKRNYLYYIMGSWANIVFASLLWFGIGVIFALAFSNPEWILWGFIMTLVSLAVYGVGFFGIISLLFASIGIELEEDQAS